MERGRKRDKSFSGRGKKGATTITTSSSSAREWPDRARVGGLTIDILEVVAEKGALTAPEIAEILRKPANYVRMYLYRMLNYGYLSKEECVWSMTPKGASVLLKRLSLRRKRNENTLRATESNRKQQKATESNRSLESRVRERLSGLPNSSDEEVVVIAVRVASRLASHHARTGRKGVLFRDVWEAAEWFGVGVAELGEALRALENAGVAYARPSRRCIKVGLFKRFVEEALGG